MKKTFMILTLISLVCVIFIGQRLWATSDTYSMLRVLNKVLKELQDDYVDEVSTDSLIVGGIDGMIDVLHDPHTDYMNKTEYTALLESTQGEFSGIGATIGRRNDQIMIISPLEGNPAYRAGLLPGDVILAVDSVSTEGKSVDMVVREIRGEPGTTVVLTIQRAMIENSFDVSITRAIIKLEAVPYYGIVSENTGYIYLRNFSVSADVELKKALDTLFAMGAKKIILDLRLNAGGLLNEGVRVSELFLPKGKEIVGTKGRNERTQVYNSQRDYPYGDFPMVTLVDGGSASASEIVAGALQDWDRSLIIGTTTFGKGSVQNIIAFDDSTALKLTTARWYTPSGRSIDKPVDWEGLDGRVITAEQKIVDKLKTEVATLSKDAKTEGEKSILSKIENNLLDVEDAIYEPRVDSTRLHEKKEFKTLGALKRTVYGEGGITPDIIIQPPRISRLETEIVTKGLSFDFVVQYTAEHKNIGKDFQISDAVLKEFAAYLLKQGVEFTEEEYNDIKSEIQARLKQDLFTNLWGIKEGYRIRIGDDPLVQRAVALLKEVTVTQDLFRRAR